MTRERGCLMAVLVTGFALLVAQPVVGQQANGMWRSVRVPGGQLAYREFGSGSALLLLHGFGSSGLDWNPVIGDLAKKYRVIIADLPGHGRSIPARQEFTHREAARDFLALADSLGLQRFSGMGHSSGAHTLLHMATMQPDRVEAMVLLAGVPYFNQAVREHIRGYPTYDHLSDEGRAWYRRAEHVNGPPQERVLHAQWKSFADTYDDMNLTPPVLSTISARTLIVCGDRDNGAPVELAVEMYRTIPNAALWVVPTAGHVFWKEIDGGSPSAAAVLPKVVLDFLDGRIFN